jgi:lysozyme family protein
MANFEQAYPIVSSNEGGYINDPEDKGGETYYGISRNNWPNWAGWIVIDKVKEERIIKDNEIIKDCVLVKLVSDFFKKEFWDVNSLGNFLSQQIANELFDTGVNMGVEVAARLLQEALNLLNKNKRNYPDILVDGDIGPITLRLTNEHRNPSALLKTLNGLQFVRYVKICERDPTQEKFFYGWLNRT